MRRGVKEERMNKDRSEKHKSEQQPEKDEARLSHAPDAERRSTGASGQKADPVERGEWSGSGVCGGRQTD
jgi:hypothetical protein